MSQAGQNNSGGTPSSDDLHVAEFIVNVNGTVGTGANYSSIASAMAAASSGDTIFVMPGTYVENVTIKAGIGLTAFTCDSLIGNVILNGTLTFSESGNAAVTGIQFLNSGAPCVVVSGSNPSTLYLKNAVLACEFAPAISYTNSNISSGIDIYDSSGDVRTSNTEFFSFSGSGNSLISNCYFTNSVLSTESNTLTSGNLVFDSSTIFSPLTTSGTSSLTIENSVIDTSQINTISLTIGSSGTNLAEEVIINSGSASAISTSQTLVTSFLTINSSNTNAITGSGTIKYGTIDFTGSSSTINTTTQTSLVTKIGSLSLNSPLTNGKQPCFSAYLGTSVTNATGNGTPYLLGSTQALTILFDNTGSMSTSGVFTAPVTGKYFFTCSVLFLNAVTANVGQISFITPTYQQNTYFFGVSNATLGIGAFTAHGNAILSLTSGQTLTFEVVGSGEAANTLTIQGTTAASQNTWIDGYMLVA